MKKKPLSSRIIAAGKRAPEGWDRSLVITEDRDLNAITVTMMDVRYHLNEDDPEALADVERVSTKELLALDQLQAALSPDEFLAVLVETMAEDLAAEHEERPEWTPREPEPEAPRSWYAVLALLATAAVAALATTQVPSNGGFIFLVVMVAVSLMAAAHLAWERRSEP